MYLTKKFYIKNWEHDTPHQRTVLSITREDGTDFNTGPGKPCYLEFEVAYWRKANAIHGWFVRNVGEGTDDCAPLYVEKDTLKELRDTCARALNTRNLDYVAEKLPPTSGFFFGSCEVDEWYWKDLQWTVDALSAELETEYEGGWLGQPSYIYQASW
jgi:hypothetical protein